VSSYQPQTLTCCLLTHHHPFREEGPAWDKELADEVKGECESSYGTVLAIKVERHSQQGEVYIKFEDIEAAKKAVKALNGRYFGGRSLEATFISDAIMQAHI